MISGSGLEGALEELMRRLLIPAGPKVMEWRHAVESRRERVREASDGHSQSSLENSVPGVGSGCERRAENSEVWAKLCEVCSHGNTFTLTQEFT